MKPLFIHRSACISAQETFGVIDLDKPRESVDNLLRVIEPEYRDIPTAILRRMGKAVRIAVGAALDLLPCEKTDGIIIGTANGGMEDCIKFLNQVIRYEEGLLTPGNFVQSTANSIASQVAMLGNNLGYNSTHVHRGLAFENAVIDAVMMVNEFPGTRYVLGGVDEISAYNYTVDCLGGWFSTKPASSGDLYEPGNPVSMAGEGATMFLVDDCAAGALAQVLAVTTLHSNNLHAVKRHLQSFLESQPAAGEKIDLFLTGENGDPRLLPSYLACEDVAGNETPVARFKHLGGEYPTSSAMALWLACQVLQQQQVPANMMKYPVTGNVVYRKILIYNNYRGNQHGFMIVGSIEHGSGA